MMRSSVARHLREFGPRSVAVESSPSLPPPLQPETGAVVSDAEESGYRRGHAAATGEAAATIAALEARLADCEAAAVRERAALAEAWNAQLEAGLKSSFAALEGRLAERIAAVLRPVLTGHLIERACDAFAETLRALERGTDGAVLTIEGPQELLDRLQARLPASDLASITIAAAPRPDLRLELNGTVIETQLERMRAALEEELA